MICMNTQKHCIDILYSSDVKSFEMLLILPSLYHVLQSKAIKKSFLKVRMKNNNF